MKSRVFQYIFIAIILTAIAGGYFYYQSKADQKINSSKVNNLTNGLVGYWTLDGADTAWTSATAGTVADKSPVGTNTGTLTNMSQSTSPVIGKIGQAFNFNGSNNYIDAGNSINITGDMTIAAWVKFSASGNKGIAGRYASWSTPHWDLRNNANDKAWFYINDASNNHSSISGTRTINDNQWHYIVGVRDAATDKLYIC